MTLGAMKMGSAKFGAGQDKDQALDWLWKNRRSDDHSMSSESNIFKRSHVISEAEIRAKSMASALDWLRNDIADNVATDNPSAASYRVAGAGD
jgi:hypothetical protein